MSLLRTASAASARLATPGVLVVALGATFTVAVTGSTRALTAVVQQSPIGSGPTALAVLGLLGLSFGVVALVVAGSVLANSTATRVAAQTHDIALRRLLGSSTRQERSRQLQQALVDALLGIAVGAPAGWLTAWALVGQPSSPVPATPVLLGIGVVSLVAAWQGSRAVASVPPAGALAVADARASGLGQPVRWQAGVVAAAAAVALLGVGAVLGTRTPLAVLPALAGGVLLAVSLPALAPVVLPGWLRLLGSLLPRSLAGRLAVRRLDESPRSTARAAVGVVLGVAVITMFVVASASFEHELRRTYSEPSVAAVADGLMDLVMATVVPMVAVIALISAIGLVETVVADSRSRAGETGLMRILGQSRHEVRSEILHAAALLAAGSAVLGVALGAAVGWVGAQSILGSVAQIHVVTPVVPPVYLLGVALLSVALTLVAAAAPLRQRLAESPVAAFTRA